MTFFDRVREKLNHDRGRNDRIQRIFASDTKIAFAGVEVLAEDLAAVKEIAENIWQMQQVLTARVDGLMDRLTGVAPIAQDAEETPADRPVLNATDKGDESPTTTTPNLVDKPCGKCGKMMEQVYPTRKYCDKCKGAK